MPAGFAVRQARREIRAAWRQFAGLVACVALGVAALVAVGTFAANLRASMSREGKTLLGGDLELRSPRPLDDAIEARLADLAAAGATTARLRELASMARSDGGTALMVEVKAVDAGYPLYGRLETRPAGALADLLADGGALVDQRLLERLRINPGDRLALGEAVLTVRGVILHEPDRSGSLLTLGPRVLVSDRTLDATGLTGPGARIRYKALVRLPEGRASVLPESLRRGAARVDLSAESANGPAAARVLRQRLTRAAEDPAVRVASFDRAQPSLRRFFDQLETYLGLVALATLFVGGVGVAAAVRTFVRRRREAIAILKCLGASSRLLVGGYLLQAAVLGIAGSLAGAVIGVVLQPLVVRLLVGVVPFAVDTQVHPGTLVRAFALGGVTTVLVALWPLLEIAAVPPSLLLRRDVDDRPVPGRRRWLAGAGIAAGLVALVMWQAGSLGLAAIFVGATVAALGLLAVIARAVVAAARRAPRPASLVLRQGIANLARPGGHTAGIVVALGTGVMLLVAIGLLEANLGRQIDHERRREVPSFFFIDIQAAQRDRFAAVVREVSGVEPVVIPIVRARLAAVNGEPVTRAGLARRRPPDDRQFYFTRDYFLSTAREVPESNVLVAGRWWEPGAARAAGGGRVLASVEEKAAESLGVAVGSTLTFDVQGVPIEADVTSVRKVDWQTFSANFMVLLSPGALDGAPETYIATARVAPGVEAALQNAVAAEMPNVTGVPVRDVFQRVDAVLGRVALAVRAIAVLAIAVGLAVMAGALVASRYQRLLESVILRTLGATRGLVARVFAVEYACLGAAAGLGGSALAVLLAWAVVHFILDTPWTFEPALVGMGVLLAVAVAVAVGFLATYRLLGQKPLVVLRRE
jgi:putative ABC transport system permease protein